MKQGSTVGGVRRSLVGVLSVVGGIGFGFVLAHLTPFRHAADRPTPSSTEAPRVASAAATTGVPNDDTASSSPANSALDDSGVVDDLEASGEPDGDLPATPVASRTFTVAATGDVLLHTQLWKQAEANADWIESGEYDYRPMFEPLRHLIGSADLAICHMETPIAPAGERYTTYPLFGVQPEVVEAMADIGYDRCSTASNHTLDRGVAGVERTIDVLELNGMGWAGSARVPTDIEPKIFDVDGIRVSHLSYTFSYNGLQPPTGEEWRSALIDADRIVADAIAARQLGAEVVLVSMHWGTENRHEPDNFQRWVAGQITDPGVIDLVIGHHAHVLQPIEQINGTWVMFGSSNILSSMPTTPSWSAATQDGAVFEVDLTVEPDGEVIVGTPRVYPTWVDRDNGYLVLPVQSAIESGEYSGERLDGLRASLDRTSAVLAQYIAPEPLMPSERDDLLVAAFPTP